jgi:pimeloyl-ACP methyl ester carboxylesterase
VRYCAGWTPVRSGVGGGRASDFAYALGSCLRNDWWKDYAPSPGVAEIRPFGSDGFVALTPAGIASAFVQDLPADEASLVYATQGPLAARCFDDKVSVAAWRGKPSWYIVAENDRTIPPAVERDSAARMKATTLTLTSGHVPMLSQPERVADFIAQAAEGAGG